MRRKGWWRYLNKSFFVSVLNRNQVIPSSLFTYILPIDFLYSKEELSGSFYVSLPKVIRNKDEEKLAVKIADCDKDMRVLGIVCHNMEGYMLLKQAFFSKEIIVGPNLYIWNNASKEILAKNNRFVVPYELSRHEIKDISDRNSILPIYGKTPLMITANCVRKSTIGCQKNSIKQFDYMIDRKKVALPVSFQCNYCYNVIYNAIPTSLHDELSKVDFISSYLISFTDESKEDVKCILSYYENYCSGSFTKWPFDNYTKAYFTHGVD